MKYLRRLPDDGLPTGQKEREETLQPVSAPVASLTLANLVDPRADCTDDVSPHLIPFVDSLAELLARQLIRELKAQRTLEARPVPPEVGIDRAGHSDSE